MRHQAILALLANAFIWGVAWWPLRWLQAQGLHPLWATALVHGSAALMLTLWAPTAWRELLGSGALRKMVLIAGTATVSFNVAMTLGDVVRAILLFYLMPLWAVLLARWLLREPLTPLALLRIALALVGAAIVLWPASGGLPLPQSVPEALALLGGFAFALNNVMVRREAQRSMKARTLAMFTGGAAMSVIAATPLAMIDAIPTPPTAPGLWMAGTLLLAVVFLYGNLALQYGASRLPAGVTAVVMVSEVLFASISAMLLGAGHLDAQIALGGSLIVAAALLAARRN
jgi:drug/metabolite transporter (DMT)-like permease